MEVDLTDYCTTNLQKNVYNTYISNKKNIIKTSKQLNVSQNSIRKTLDRISNNYKKCIKNSDTVDVKKYEEMDVRSTSTLYNRDGEIVSKWVKKDSSKNHIKKIVNDYIKEFSKKLPKYEPIVNNIKLEYEEKLAIYPIVDAHIGMLSWQPETGCNYDTKTADEIIRNIVSRMMDRTPSCEECLICNLGDFLHVDNQVYQTERSGNTLDVDGRYFKILNVGIKLMRYMIEYALIKHKHVTVINCPGNHDDLGSLWLSAALSHIYENEDDITILSSCAPRQYYRYGNVLIGCTHGNNINLKDLPLTMATEMSEDWGSCKYRYFYTGHLHHDRIADCSGCKVETFRAICTKDAYANSKGYLTDRDLKCIIIDPNEGECERYTINIK